MDEIQHSFVQANYAWILLSIFIGIASHFVRALRWQITLTPLKIPFRLSLSFYTVMIGYLVNMAIPRAGELSRALYYARYQQVAFDKTFGTIIAERVIDTILLIFIIIGVFFMEYEKISPFILQSSFGVIFTSPLYFSLVTVLLVLGGIAFIRYLKISSSSFAEKIRHLLGGFINGLLSVFRMQRKGLFFFYTFLIWFMYYAMFHIALLCLPETAHVPLEGVVAAFITGGLSIAVTNGGIGAFPLAIREILLLYGISANTGYAFGWIIWTAQTLMIVVLGGISLILLPLIKSP